MKQFEAKKNQMSSNPEKKRKKNKTEKKASKGLPSLLSPPKRLKNFFQKKKMLQEIVKQLRPKKLILRAR